jgi:hypothetical protein
VRDLWFTIRRPIGFLLASALVMAAIFIIHAIPELLLKLLGY